MYQRMSSVMKKKTVILGDFIVDINNRSPSHAEQVFFASFRSDWFKTLIKVKPVLTICTPMYVQMFYM